MAIPRRNQVTVVEYHADVSEWWVMLPDGSIEVRGTPEAVMKRIRAEAARGNRGITITRIEWRDTPAGFIPPVVTGGR